jgi:flagellar hook-associated protein 1 FlgK
MGLTQAIGTAASGLQVAQQQLSIIAGNVANAQTPGYVRKTLDQFSTAVGSTIGVQTGAVNRTLDQLVQRQLRTENAGGSYAAAMDSLYQQIQQVIGQPGASTGLDTLYNNFTSALQALSTSPSSYSAQSSAVNAAQMLAQQLNSTSDAVQQLRVSAEQGITNDVNQANSALQTIAKLNQDIAVADPNSPATATMMDQRDSAIDQLSKLIDIRVVNGSNNQVTVYTGSGMQLVGGGVTAQLNFDAHDSITASSQWSSDPAQRGVGTLTVVTSANGAPVDLIANQGIKSGEIAAYLKMRDEVLPQLQSQLDEFASQMSAAVSNQTVSGTAVSAGAQNGFDLDIGQLSNGNSVNLTYTDATTNTTHTVRFVRVDSAAVLPLQSDPGSNVQTVGIDFSRGMTSVFAQIAQALGGTGLAVSNPSGTTLRVLDNGATNTVKVNALSATVTATGFSSGAAQLPLFTDGTKLYSGAITVGGAQETGYAGRITVNSSLLSNPALLVGYQPSGTAAGDSTRPSFLYGQLTSGALQFSSAAGIGTSTAPFSGTLTSYLSQIFTSQGQAANDASSLNQGQQLVVNALQQRMNDTSGVNVDQEMSNLLTLQNSYAANAHVFTAIKQMFDTLMQM